MTTARTYAPILLLALLSLALLCALPGTALAGSKLELVSSTPAAPKMGDTLSITFKIMDEEPYAPQDPTYVKTVWAEPGEDYMSGEYQDLSTTDLAENTWVQFTRSWLVTRDGTYKLYARLGNQGRGWQTTTALSFTVAVNWSTVADAKTCLKVTATHTPASPKADMPTQGSPDRRDKVTFTVTAKNSSPGLKMKPWKLFVAHVPPNAAFYDYSWTEDIPALYPGETKVTTTEFKEEVPGAHRYDFYLYSYDGTNVDSAGIGGGGGYKLSSYTITFVPAIARTFNVAVDPNPGAYGANFTYWVTYKSSDNQAPTKVMITIDGLAAVQMTRDNAQTGMVYKYTKTLAYGAHQWWCQAFKDTTVLLESGVTTGPTITDPVAPTVTGASPGADLATDQAAVTLTGTAADPASGLSKVQWSKDQTNWTTATGTATWSLYLTTGCADQEQKTLWVYVRAQDQAGNYTAAANYYKRQIVCDRRHPRIVGTFITDSSMFDGLPSGIQHAKPPDHGTPTMNNMYYVCFKIENVSDKPMTINFGWKDVRYTVVRRQGNDWAQWSDNMDAADSWGPSNIPMEGKEVIWLNTTWKHRWDWIPPQDFVDFLIDLGSAYIPVANEVLDYLQFSAWGDTLHYFIPKVKWQTGCSANSLNLFPVPESFSVEIKVSVPKQVALYSSLSSMIAGWGFTTVGMCLVWNPPAAAVCLISQAGFITASHLLYWAAYDPDSSFSAPVKLKPVTVKELDKVTDPKLRKQGEAAVLLAQNARALYEAYTKYLGAVEGGDEKWARTHAQEAAQFARAASAQTKALQPLFSQLPGWLEQSQPEDVDAAKQALSAGKLPEMELAVMRELGMTDKDIQQWQQPCPDLVSPLLSDPKLAGVMNQRLTKSLDQFAAEMDKAGQ